MKTLTAVLLLCGCAHTQPTEMTASEHRAEASRHQQIAATAPPPTHLVETRSPFADEGPQRPYNPTAERLDEAQRQLALSFEHLRAAQALETFEATACQGISVPERSACPLLAPHTAIVEELAQGLALHLKPNAPATRLIAQLQCHLAFAQARGFDRAPCPLYVKGVAITRVDNTIEFKSVDPKVAAEVRREGRKLFGAPTGTR